jgi:CDP-6-deoxy-D-xylo-4-hexulose-3-dehydrase
MGEGGAVFTSDPVLRRAAEAFRDWGRDCYCDPGKENTCKRRFDWQLGDLPHGYDHKYIYSHMGFNMKITDMQAAVGVSQLTHLDEFIAARRRNFSRLKTGLADLEEFFVMPEPTPGSEPSWFGFLLTVRENSPFDRNAIVRHLDAHKIGTRLLFGGNLIRQPYMKGRQYRVHGTLENSDRVVDKTFWIGVFPGIGEPEVEYVLDVIHRFCREATARGGEGRA